MSEMFGRLEKNIKKIKQDRNKWKEEFHMMKTEMFDRIEKNVKKIDDLGIIADRTEKSVTDIKSQLKKLDADLYKKSMSVAEDRKEFRENVKLLDVKAKDNRDKIIEKEDTICVLVYLIDTFGIPCHERM